MSKLSPVTCIVLLPKFAKSPLTLQLCHRPSRYDSSQQIAEKLLYFLSEHSFEFRLLAGTFYYCLAEAYIVSGTYTMQPSQEEVGQHE